MKNYIFIFLIGISLCFYFGCTTAAPLNTIYFETNSVILVEQSQPLLNNIGQKMKDNPVINIRLLNFYAPPLTTEWQILRDDGTPAISAARAEYVAEYLEQNYSVNETRINIEYKDVKEAETKDKMKEIKDIKDIYRCVLIIIEGDKK